MRVLATLLLILMLAACGGDDSTGPSLPRSISGTVIKGPVLGASVTVLDVDASGNPGALVAGPFVTDAEGRWTGEVGAGENGPFFLLATGGSYEDEASAATVDIGTGTMMAYTADGSGVVSPFTQLLCDVVGAADPTWSTSAAWAGAIAAFEQSFGFDPTRTVPSSTGTVAERSYLGALGGLSRLVDVTPALSSLSGVGLYELVMALVEDMADGVLDGESLGASTITIDGSVVVLPAIDVAGLDALVAAMNGYADSVAALADLFFAPVDLDFSELYEPIRGGTGELTISGPGTSSLPETDFDATSVVSPSADVHFWRMPTSDSGTFSVSIVDATSGSGFFRSVLFAYTNGFEELMTWETLYTSNGGAVTKAGNKFTLVNVILPSNDGLGNLTLDGVLTYGE